MPREPGKRLQVTGELGLFTETVKRSQPRDAHGKFVRVQYSAHRLKVLAVVRDMRERMGMPPHPLLTPFERKKP